MDIATYRLTQPRGWFSEKQNIKIPSELCLIALMKPFDTMSTTQKPLALFVLPLRKKLGFTAGRGPTKCTLFEVFPDFFQNSTSKRVFLALNSVHQDALVRL